MCRRFGGDFCAFKSSAAGFRLLINDLRTLWLIAWRFKGCHFTIFFKKPTQFLSIY
jgi:hypothetical protein